MVCYLEQIDVQHSHPIRWIYCLQLDIQEHAYMSIVHVYIILYHSHYGYSVDWCLVGYKVSGASTAMGGK